MVFPQSLKAESYHGPHKVNSLLRVANFYVSFCFNAEWIQADTYKNPLAGITNLASGNVGLMENGLLNWLGEKLNFTQLYGIAVDLEKKEILTSSKRYAIVVPKEVRILGILQPNGSWMGTFGLLARRVKLKYIFLFIES